MADKEWRVSIKALYVLHRFAANGSSEHAVNLKESVAVLRTHHDSRRKVHACLLEGGAGLRGRTPREKGACVLEGG